MISAELIHLYQSHKQEYSCSHSQSNSMCVSLGLGLLLQLHMDEPKAVCPTLSRWKENSVMHFYRLQSSGHHGEVGAISRTNISSVHFYFSCFWRNSQPFFKVFQLNPLQISTENLPYQILSLPCHQSWPDYQYVLQKPLLLSMVTFILQWQIYLLGNVIISQKLIN